MKTWILLSRELTEPYMSLHDLTGYHRAVQGNFELVKALEIDTFKLSLSSNHCSLSVSAYSFQSKVVITTFIPCVLCALA